MTDDAIRWDQRYRAAPAVTAAAPEPLAEFADLLPTGGQALDLACGLGAQSLWLANRGFQVTALDVSSVAIERLRAAALDAGLADRIEALCIDLDAGVPIAPTTFDIVICRRYRNPTLYGPIVERLAKNGVGLVSVLSVVDVESPGRFHAPPGELVHAFTRDDVELLHAREGDGTATVVFRRIA